MTIYIATYEAGQGNTPTLITEYDNKKELVQVAQEALSRSDTTVSNHDSISNICDALYDMGHCIYYGSRNHARISRVDAIAAIRGGARNYTFL